jgi:hypothetical protein
LAFPLQPFLAKSKPGVRLDLLCGKRSHSDSEPEQLRLWLASSAANSVSFWCPHRPQRWDLIWSISFNMHHSPTCMADSHVKPWSQMDH